MSSSEVASTLECGSLLPLSPSGSLLPPHLSPDRGPKGGCQQAGASEGGGKPPHSNAAYAASPDRLPPSAQASSQAPPTARTCSRWGNHHRPSHQGCYSHRRFSSPPSALIYQGAGHPLLSAQRDHKLKVFSCQRSFFRCRPASHSHVSCC